MADSPKVAKSEEPKSEGAKSGGKSGGTKLDLASLTGIGLALAGILGGLILEKGSIQDIAQFTAALIVLGGTFGAVLLPLFVAWPFHGWVRLPLDIDPVPVRPGFDVDHVPTGKKIQRFHPILRLRLEENCGIRPGTYEVP